MYSLINKSLADRKIKFIENRPHLITVLRLFYTFALGMHQTRTYLTSILLRTDLDSIESFSLQNDYFQYSH